jgi:hypothetical protein
VERMEETAYQILVESLIGGKQKNDKQVGG